MYWDRDQEAIAQTDKKYGQMLFHLSNTFVRCTADAEECVSDTYLRAWNTMPPQRPKFLGAFLSKITRCISIDKYRKNSRESAVTSPLTAELEDCIPDGFNIDSFEENERLKKVLDRFISSLSDEYRVMFIRRYFNSDSIFVIAQRMCCSETKVKTALHRIRRNLREVLEKEELM